MPTFGEIMCPRSEYLPVRDPAQWHVAGIDGLLDRNFRLLREDAVGQLRDAIKPQLKTLPNTTKSKDEKSHRTQTYIYSNAKVVSLGFDRRLGFRFKVEFPQLADVRIMTENERKEWWQASKRLQADALVCLADSRG